MTEFIVKMSHTLNNLVWGPVMVTLIICIGIFLSLMTGFPQFAKFGHVMRETVLSLFSKKQHIGTKSAVSSFQAVATALAGTIGTGSIAGLATAIVSGGPGAVFWMWVSALFGMATKYTEIALAVKYREKGSLGIFAGGPMYYIKNGLSRRFAPLGYVFCVFAMFACLGTGNTTQSNSIALSVSQFVPPHITGIVLTAISALVILGGMKRIASVNERLVPFMALFYIACALASIVINIDKVGSAFLLIFRDAFNIRSAVGGTAGYGIGRAMQYGFSRGILINEAGLGTAPVAHAAANISSPAKQALWGIFEVFFTTFVIGTLSALVILTTDLWQTGNIDGAQLSIRAFDSAMPGIGGAGVTLSTIFFALSSILGWAYYGEVSVGFLTHNCKTAITIYRLIYIAFVYIGAVGRLETIWDISSAMNSLMAMPNLIALVFLAPKAKKISDDYFRGI